MELVVASSWAASTPLSCFFFSSHNQERGGGSHHDMIMIGKTFGRCTMEAVVIPPTEKALQPDNAIHWALFLTSV